MISRRFDAAGMVGLLLLACGGVGEGPSSNAGRSASLSGSAGNEQTIDHTGGRIGSTTSTSSGGKFALTGSAGSHASSPYGGGTAGVASTSTRCDTAGGRTLEDSASGSSSIIREGGSAGSGGTTDANSGGKHSNTTYAAGSHAGESGHSNQMIAEGGERAVTILYGYAGGGAGAPVKVLHFRGCRQHSDCGTNGDICMIPAVVGRCEDGPLGICLPLSLRCLPGDGCSCRFYAATRFEPLSSVCPQSTSCSRPSPSSGCVVCDPPTAVGGTGGGNGAETVGTAGDSSDTTGRAGSAGSAP
ncbi:MAG TPA: hypothetical protein VIV60_21695 [Polyangiaceae bacterium]